MHLCEACHQEAATFHLTEIIEGKKRERHLCETCAQKEGVSPLTPQSLFSQFVEPAAKGSQGEEVDIQCESCGLTYGEFRRRGRLGCGEDYKLFREGLVKLLDRIHGSVQHLGKVPLRGGEHLKREREMIELQRELARVIQREEYEKAADLRDRLRELEEESGTD